MKKFLFALMLGITMMMACNDTNAQSTSPRFGTTAGRDNTFRPLKLAYTTLTDAAGADSTTLVPTRFDNVYRVAMTDSLYFKSPTVTNCYAGDRMTIIATGDSGDKLKFAGTNFITAGTATLSSSGAAVINLVFSGAKWIEASRVVQ